MTFADWKLDLDSELNPEVTIDDAYDLVMKSVAPLGNEYAQEVSRYQEERWVDFAANANKDSGGYATDPYKVHPCKFFKEFKTVSLVFSYDLKFTFCNNKQFFSINTT